jgi:hypothetical protein
MVRVGPLFSTRWDIIGNTTQRQLTPCVYTPYAAAMVIDERSRSRCGLCLDWCPIECLTMDHFRLTPGIERESVDLAIVAD